MIVTTVSLMKYKDSIFRHGFSRQYLAKTEGTDYGDGVYCNINIEDSIVRWRNYLSQGSIIVKVNFSGDLNRFLVFDKRFANQIHGESSIKNQVYSLFGEDADKVWRDFDYIMKSDYSAREHFNGRTAELLQVLLRPGRRHDLMRMLPPEDRGRNVRSEYERLFKKHQIGGVIYRGLKDGLCFVAYDFSTCTPVAYSTDGGKTWKNQEFTGRLVDVHRNFGLKYKHIDHPVHLKYKGQDVSLSIVMKKNGKYNYINAETGEEISPIDFDSVTKIDPQTYRFSIEYAGEHLTATPEGFYFNEDDEAMNIISPFEDLRELDESSRRRYNSLFENIVKETICELGLNEEILDEADYMDYDIPTLEQLDSPDMITLYHVTHKRNVESIFKFGMDRVFGNVMAYGDGVYSTFSVENARSLIGSRYGDVILQLKLIGGFDRFLIFDRNLARKYYGDNWQIIDQLKTMVPEDIAEKLYSRYGNCETSYARHAIEYKIRGAVYPWGGCTAVLPYDFSSTIPYAASYDYGKTFKKKATQDTVDRFHGSLDVKYRFGDTYREYGRPIKYKDANGNLTSYFTARKHNGKWNMVNGKTGEEISPIDFESVNPLDSETGKFMFEYAGEHLTGTISGFYFNEDDEEMDIISPFEDLRELD
jgi:hypothetical protein